MARTNRRDAAHERISRAQKCQEQREGTKYVRQWLAAYITHRQEFPFTGQDEIDAPGKPFDGARLNRAAHADAMRARCAIEGRQFGNSVIVRFALAITEPREKTQRHHDYPDADP